MAVRSNCTSPSTRRARIRLKSVVPPPMSQIKIQFAIAEVFIIPGLLASIRRDPRIKRGHGFFEQSELSEPGAAGGFDRPAHALPHRTNPGHGEDDFLMLKTRFVIHC